MKEVYEFLRKSKVFYLGTVEDNKPDIRPFGALNIFEDKLYIQTGKSKNVSKQMKSNPNIFICAMYEDKWLRLSAEVVEDDRVEAKEDMLNNNPELKSMYSKDDPNTSVLYLKNVDAKIYSFMNAPVEYRF